MKSGSPSAFAKAREEIQLWPAAAMAFYFTVHDTVFTLVSFLVLVWAGASTYKMHESLREVLTSKRGLNELREHKSRGQGRGDSDRYSEILDLPLNIWDSIKPDNRLFRVVVVVAMMLNLGAGFYLFFWLGMRLLASTSPSVAGVGLISLPLLMLATMTATLVWTS